MGESFGSRLQHAWNAFFSRDPTKLYREDIGLTYSNRPDRLRLKSGNERSIISAIYNQISTDVAAIDIRHVRLDENERYAETVKSGLNNCLTLEANIDQSGRAFIQDIMLSMFEEGAVAIVPVDTTSSPTASNSYDIQTMRTGKILEWAPRHVRVNVYNDKTGQREELTLPKTMVAIIENPFYAVMNEPNSIARRLVEKLNLLDAIDNQSGSGKLDIIIQLPFIVKSPARILQAEERRKQIENQLTNSKYGIAYIDGTEHVTQLNRPVENNLMAQIEFLTSMLYSQLGLTKAIFDGTADEATMLNYYNRTVEPSLSAITGGMKRTLLTKTARSQGQSIMYFRDSFKLVPLINLADIADKFTRNAILSSNEMRSVVGFKPSKQPDADELRNKNLNQADNQEPEKISRPPIKLIANK
jgi:hypothetical protein